MTTMPQPNSPGNPYSAIFDAWQRLRFLNDTSGPTPVPVQENRYDGRNFRTTKLAYTSGSVSESRDFYYTDSWQTLEERVSGIVNRQYVWGLRYIDDLVLRDRTTGSGSLAERLYAMQDDNWNMAAIYDPTSSAIKERFAYTAYGVMLALNPTDFSFPYTGTDYDWTILFTGRALDDESGLYYYRMRYYHPGLGVFVSRDPMGPLAPYAGGYRYVLNNPLIYLDPNGMVLALDSLTGTLQRLVLTGQIDEALAFAKGLGYTAVQLAAVAALAAAFWSELAGSHYWDVIAATLRTGAIAGSLGTATSWCGQHTPGSAAYCSCLVLAYNTIIARLPSNLITDYIRPSDPHAYQFNLRDAWAGFNRARDAAADAVKQLYLDKCYSLLNPRTWWICQ